MAKTTDTPPTAAEALAILEGPERERRAAKEVASAAVTAKAQRTLAEAAIARRAVVVLIAADLTAWFDVRPKMVATDLEEVHVRNLERIDRVVGVGTRLLERAAVGQVEAQRVLSALEQPVDDVALRALHAAVAELEKREPGLKKDHTRWRELRAEAGAPLQKTGTVNLAQARWMMGDEGPRHD